MAVLQPSGPVGLKERNLILAGLLLAVLVVVPVYAMTIFIAMKYRESNVKARYSPDWEHSRALELTWWAIPGFFILIFSIIAWNSAHALDPFKPLSSSKPPLKIQVVSLDWKWLFIYPKQGIASVNLVEIPTNVPIEFHVTSDSVMNSFWVPALGGQIYSMPGMDTQLHVSASKSGDFGGSSANISGRGFAGMDFTVRAISPSKFQNWVKKVQVSSQRLDQTGYNRLSTPSTNNPKEVYSSVKPDLYNDILLKYAAPSIREEVRLGTHGGQVGGWE